MKKNPTSNVSSLLNAVALAAILSPLSSLRAATDTWTWSYGGTQSWGTNGCWSTDNVPQPGDVADLSTAAQTSNMQITLTSQPNELSGMYIGTAPGGTGTYTITNTGNPGNYLEFGSGSSAFITVVPSSLGDTIAAPVVLDGSNGNGVLNVTNNSTNALTISGSITQVGGSSGVINLLAGGLTLTATNTFTGGANIQAGTLTVNTFATGVTSVGSGTVTLGGAAGTSGGAALLMNPYTTGNYNFNNPIVVNPGNSGTYTIGTLTYEGSTPNRNSLTLAGGVTLNNQGVTFSAGEMGVTLPAGGLSGTGNVIFATNTGTPSSSGVLFGVPNGATVTLSGANSFQGNVEIASGGLALTGAGADDSELGASTNTLTLGGTSGIVAAKLSFSTDGSTLAKNITVENGNAGEAILGSAGNTTISGNITLNKSVVALSANGKTLSLTGAISTGAGAIGGVDLIKSGDRGATVKLTAANSYNGGSVVGEGTLDANVAGSLGSGNAVVEGGDLQLDAAALASGKTVMVGQNGYLYLNYSTTANALYALIDPASSGGIAISGNDAGTSLNLASFGDGYMFLGGGQTYGLTTLSPNKDGNYRLGYGNATISNGVINGASAELIVGGSAGSTNPLNGSVVQNQFYQNGTVTLKGANSYGGGTIINNYSTLWGYTQASGSPFGSTTASVTMNNATLELTNGTVATSGSASVGNVTYDGNSAIIVNGTSSTQGTDTLNLASLTRNNNGTLTITATNASNAYLTVASAPATSAINGGTNQILPAYYFDTHGNYLTYNAGTGFTAATPGTTISTANATIVPVTGFTTNDQYVQTTVSTGTVSLSGNILTVSDISLGSSLTSGTLNVTNGGVNCVAATSGVTISSGLNFSGTEGIVALGSQQVTITGLVSGSGGLTKTGAGALLLSDNSNNFSGQITVNQGILESYNNGSDGVFGASTNGILLNGGGLQESITTGTASIGAGHAITIGPDGGTINVTPRTAIIINGVVSGGGVYFNVNNSSGDYIESGTLLLANSANTFTSPINVTGRTTLQIANVGALGTGTNALSLIGGDAALLYTGATSDTISRSLAFNDQGGAVDVQTAGVALSATSSIAGSGIFNKNGLGTLILTGSGSETGNILVNAGVLNVQNAYALGASSGVVTGSSGVSGGAVFVQPAATLQMQNNIAVGNKTLWLNGSGVSGGGALENVSGSNSIAGAVILQSNASIGVDAGSLTLSGSIIEPLSTAGIQTGNNSLTKVGAGTLKLTGINTYAGPTNVNAGTLLVSGALNGSSSTMVAATATLGGNGQIANSVTVNGTLAPGAGLSTAGTQLTIGNNVTFNNGSQYAVNLDDPNGQVDLLAITGSLTINSGASLAINLVNGGLLTSGSTYEIASFTSGDLTGTFANVSLDGQSLSNFGYQVVYDNSDGVIDLQAVPEPSTWASFVGGLACIGLFGSRRRFRSHSPRN